MSRFWKYVGPGTYSWLYDLMLSQLCSESDGLWVCSLALWLCTYISQEYHASVFWFNQPCYTPTRLHCASIQNTTIWSTVLRRLVVNVEYRNCGQYLYTLRWSCTVTQVDYVQFCNTLGSWPNAPLRTSLSLFVCLYDKSLTELLPPPTCFLQITHHSTEGKA
jgi:hypothetical protein